MATLSFDTDIIKDGFTRYSAISISMLILFILTRIIEYGLVLTTHIIPTNSFEFEWLGLGYDLFFFLQISAILCIPFLLFHMWKPKAALIFYSICLGTIALLQLILAQYFAKMLVPLGVDVFGYEWAEVSYTVKASLGGLKALLLVIPLLTIGAICYYLPKYFSQFQAPRYFSLAFLGVLVVSLFIAPMTQPVQAHYAKDVDYYLVTNKTRYFLASCYQKQQEEAKIAELTANVVQVGNKQENQYPLWHQENTPDVLGPYLKKADQKPNLVFLIVEGLSSAFSGEHAELKSFTPFLDSLSQKSLYFPNCLSTTGRTFGVLPALFSSAPYGNHGFMEMEDKMPQHQSLLSLVKEQGYKTHFYYGGPLRFDRKDIYFKRHGLDFMQDVRTFGEGYEKMNPNESGFSWGYSDKSVFKRSFELMEKQGVTPRLDVYLTMTTHDPFRFKGEEQYYEVVEKHFDQLGFDAAKKEKYQTYVQQYAAVMFADDALKDFFKEYQKRPDFENTVFVITGDHRMDVIPLSTQIDRFRVPLMVYSPLLKKTETFAGVSTHFDITPTVLAYLRDNYEMSFPKASHWLGGALDMNKEFNNTRSIALMRNKNQLLDYIHEDYFLSNGDLYKVYKNLYIEKYKNDSIKQVIESKFNQFKALNQYVCYQNKLMPKAGEQVIANTSIQSPQLMPVHASSHEQSTNTASSHKTTIKEKYKGLLPDDLFEEARQLAFNRDFIDARNICHYLLEKEPDFHDTRTLLGRTYLWENKYDEARTHFEEVLRRAPDYPDAATALTTTEMRAGRLQEGLELANKALEISPNYETLLVAKAKIQEQLGEFSAAAQTLEKVFVLNPENRTAQIMQRRLANK